MKESIHYYIDLVLIFFSKEVIMDDSTVEIILKNILVFFFSIFIFFITSIIVRFITSVLKKRMLHKINVDILPFLYEEKVFLTLVYVVPITIFHFLSYLYTSKTLEILMKKISLICISIVIVLFVNKTLHAFNEYYKTKKISQNRPLTGFVQIFEILVVIIGILNIISILLEQSFTVLISGLGAFTAVILFIFRETFLSLLASVQIQLDHTLEVGDWIEVPNSHISGIVMDITLFVVKVKNWDNTISTLPARKIIEESYINWKNVSYSKIRRVLHQFPIDHKSIHLLKEKEVEKVKEILEAPLLEVAVANNRKLRSPMTNISLLRHYIFEYVKSHPNVLNDEFITVRYYSGDGVKGLALEIYFFIDQTTLVLYENTKSEIVEYVTTLISVFGLKYHHPIDSGQIALDN